jgi:uncharacterized protein
MLVSRLKNPLAGTACVVAAAALIWWLWWVIMEHASSWAMLHLPYGYHLIVEHLAGCIFLLCAGVAYHRWIAPIGLGCVRQRSSVLPAVAVLAVYTIEFGYGKLTGQSPETWVINLLHQPLWQLITVFITILVLAPVGEEILFRGVLLNVFRTTHAWTLWVGVVIISLVFASVHSQYQNLSTLAEMVALSGIFAWARIRSGGLLLPILLHSFASVLGTVFSLI